MDMSLRKFWEVVKDREAWHDAVHGVTKSRTWFSDWTTSMFLLVKGVWRPFLLWASVLGKDAKKTLKSYPLQESLWAIRKERICCQELDMTQQLSTHKERKERLEFLLSCLSSKTNFFPQDSRGLCHRSHWWEQNHMTTAKPTVSKWEWDHHVWMSPNMVHPWI